MTSISIDFRYQSMHAVNQQIKSIYIDDMYPLISNTDFYRLTMSGACPYETNSTVQHRKGTAKKLYSGVAAISQHFRSLSTANVQLQHASKRLCSLSRLFAAFCSCVAAFRSFTRQLQSSCLRLQDLFF